MSFQELRGKGAAFWTIVQVSCDVKVPMRHQLRIRVAFAPTRLAGEHLQAAYEQVVPVARRCVRRQTGREEITVRARRPTPQRERRVES
jgi:hypothetical protein